jgi:plastocyanin
MSTRRKTVLAIVMVPVVLLLTLASVSLASAHPAGTATHPTAKKPKITISAFAFTVPKSVKPGAKIVVINKDAVLHSVTANDGTSFGVDVPANGRASFKAPKTSGTYDFHCRIHLSMKGSLVVK